MGTSFGAPSPLEVELAELLCSALPSLDMVRFVNSGTEATMSAIRLARAHTGRNVVVKFDGCYHGHADSFLVRAGSGLITLGIPGSPGVPDDIVKNTVSIPYNDIPTFKATLGERGGEIACVIVEPVAGNMGVVLPEPGFLETLRTETAARGIVLIFDEVITGFRLAYGGAQTRFGIEPDLTTPGQDHRRRLAGCGLWRQTSADEQGRARRPGISGRHPVGQSAGHGRRHHHAEAPARAGLLRGAGGKSQSSGRRAGRACAGCRCASYPESYRLHDDLLFLQGPGGRKSLLLSFASK